MDHSVLCTLQVLTDGAHSCVLIAGCDNVKETLVILGRRVEVDVFGDRHLKQTRQNGFVLSPDIDEATVSAESVEQRVKVHVGPRKLLLVLPVCGSAHGVYQTTTFDPLVRCRAFHGKTQRKFFNRLAQ